jgi:hypothetical protein
VSEKNIEAMDRFEAELRKPARAVKTGPVKTDAVVPAGIAWADWTFWGSTWKRELSQWSYTQFPHLPLEASSKPFSEAALFIIRGW